MIYAVVYGKVRGSEHGGSPPSLYHSTGLGPAPKGPPLYYRRPCTLAARFARSLAIYLSVVGMSARKTAQVVSRQVLAEAHHARRPGCPFFDGSLSRQAWTHRYHSRVHSHPFVRSCIHSFIHSGITMFAKRTIYSPIHSKNPSEGTNLDEFTRSLVSCSSIRPFNNSFMCAFMHPSVHPSICPSIHPFYDSFIHSFYHFGHLSVNSFVHPLIYLLMHALVDPLFTRSGDGGG